MDISQSMTRRTALWLTGIAMVALAIVLMALDRQMTDAGGPGIVGLEFAGSRDRVNEILADWGKDGHDAALLSLWIDYAYMAAYGAFWAFAAAATRDLSRRRGWSRFAAIGATAVFLPITAAVLDALENVGLLLAIGGHGGEAAPSLASIFAAGKFLAIGLAILYVLARAGAARASARGANAGRMRLS
jgi:hypothetical protein